MSKILGIALLGLLLLTTACEQQPVEGTIDQNAAQPAAPEGEQEQAPANN